MKRLLAVAFACVLTTAHAAQDSWKPTRPVALIVPNAPGGNSDRVAREMERVLRTNRLVQVPIVIINRAGGAGTVALQQLVASPGDAHVLLMGTPGVLSNHITGLSPHRHTDFTTLVLLVEDYYGVNVRTASPLQSAREIVDRVRKQPDALTLGTSGVTGSNFTSLLVAFKRGGVDTKRLKIVSFAGGGQSTMALLGGHIDILSTGLSNMAEHLQQGKMRLLAISSPQRRPGIFAGVPTWREIGIDMTQSTWRTVMAPKGLTPAQIAYWENVFRQMAETEEWKKDVADNHWENTYLPAAEALKRLERDYVETRQVLADLGMAK